MPRPYARCLQDRNFVHRGTLILGQKPAPWGMPIFCWPTCRRKGSAMRRLGRQPTMPNISRHHLPCRRRPRAMSGCDPAPYRSTRRPPVRRGNGFCRRPFMCSWWSRKGPTWWCACVAPDSPPPREKGKRGGPRLYGPRFVLNDLSTWHDPDVEGAREETRPNGRQVRVHLKAWYEMRMRGRQDYPMHRCPLP